MAKAALVAFLLGLVFAIPSVSFAQDPNALSEEERATLGGLFSEAREAYEANDFQTSIDKLEAAYQIFPEPNILYRIAEMQEQLGQPGAAQTYERYLKANPNATNEKMVRERIARLQKPKEPEAPQTARVTLETDPPGAKLYINDMQERRGVTPLEVELAPGKYTVRLVKDGYEEGMRNLEVKAGELRTFDFTLARIQVEQPPPPPEEPSILPWVTMSVGGAVAIGAVTMFALSVDRENQIEEWDSQRDTIGRPDDYQQTLDEQETFRNVSYVLGGTAVVLIGASVAWLLLSDDSEPETGGIVLGDRYIGYSGRF